MTGVTNDTGDLVIIAIEAHSTAIRYTERLADAGIELSVGSRGDAYDNALAETVIERFKTEVIRPPGPWRSVEAAYAQAAGQFLLWCEARHLTVRALAPLRVAAYIRTHRSIPRVKQHLAAIRPLRLARRLADSAGESSRRRAGTEARRQEGPDAGPLRRRSAHPA